MRFQDENEGSRAAPLWSLQERPEGHVCPNMPRGFAPQEAASFIGRHVLDAFEVKVYARGQRRLRLLKRCAVRCDVEVGADCVPLVTADASVALEREVHLGIPFRDVTTAGQRTTAIPPRLALRRRRIE